MEYKKKSRILSTSRSPRDLQNRLNNQQTSNQSNQIIVDLMLEVSSLKDELNNLKQGKQVASDEVMYTAEEFNQELTKALKKELSNNAEVIRLAQELSVLNLKLEVKDLKIESLIKDNKPSNNVTPPRPKDEVVKIGKRPVIEDVVIDPTEDTNLESHINIKEVKEDKTNMLDKVEKLKALLGSST